MLSTVAAANSFFSCMYQAALFLKPSERDLLLDSGHTCANAYRDCAQRAFAWGITRWKFQPKLHFFGEILHPLEVQQRENRPSVNPLAWGTQADEDFVGTISSFSRMVSVRTVHERTIQKYQVGLAMRWWREEMFYRPQVFMISYGSWCGNHIFPIRPARSSGVSISYRMKLSLQIAEKIRLAGGVMWGYEGCKVTVIDIWYIWYDFKFDIHWCHMMYANIFLIYI